MIALVTGKIGGGKTLFCVGRIVKHLAKGGYVFTNIDLNWEALADLCKRRFRVRIKPEQLRRVDPKEHPDWHNHIDWGVFGFPVLVVLDEIHLFFNAREWAKTAKNHTDLLSFLSQSRKAAVDVLFICQVATTLEKQFRVQSEVEYSLKKLSDIHVPFLGTLPLNRMLLVTKDNADDPGRTAILRRQLLPYDKALFPVYQTAAFLDRHMEQAAANVQRLAPLKLERVRWWKNPTLWKSLLGIVILILWIRFRYLT